MCMYKVTGHCMCVTCCHHHCNHWYHHHLSFSVGSLITGKHPVKKTHDDIATPKEERT